MIKQTVWACGVKYQFNVDVSELQYKENTKLNFCELPACLCLSDWLKSIRWWSRKRRTKQRLQESAVCLWRVTGPKNNLQTLAMKLDPQTQSKITVSNSSPGISNPSSSYLLIQFSHRLAEPLSADLDWKMSYSVYFTEQLIVLLYFSITNNARYPCYHFNFYSIWITEMC